MAPAVDPHPIRLAKTLACQDAVRRQLRTGLERQEPTQLPGNITDRAAQLLVPEGATNGTPQRLAYLA